MANLSETLYNFQKEKGYNLEFKRGDVGIYTLDKETPCFAEILSYYKKNTYPTVDIQAYIPVSQRSAEITPNGLEERLIWMLQPQQRLQVQICYPDVKFERVPVALDTPQAGEGFHQTMSDIWIPKTVTNQPRVQGISSNNVGKFFPTADYNFRIHLHRYEYEDAMTKQKVKAVDKTLPNTIGYYANYGVAFQDYFDAKYSNPAKFLTFGERLNPSQQWDLIEILVDYKHTIDTEAEVTKGADFYFGATGQTTTLPVDLNDIPQNSRILRTERWWTNERMAEVMDFVAKRNDIQVVDVTT